MSLNYIIIVLFIIEIVVLILIVCTILVKRIVGSYQNAYNKSAHETLTRIILSSLEKENDSQLNEIAPYANSEILVKVLESFDDKLKGGYWEKLKDEISTRYLLKRARHWVTSPFLKNRNFAARCFVLNAKPSDEKKILKLVDDPKFLVNSFVCLACLRLEKKEGVLKILRHIAKNQGYARFYYCDILIQGSNQVFEWVEDIALNTKDNAIHLACLEVLARKTSSVNEELLRRDFSSTHPEIRCGAVKVLAHNPQFYSEELLLISLGDENETIREESAFGLQFFESEKSVSKLIKALEDESWAVRTQAAKSLKEMGQVDILNRQDSSKNRKAYEAAQYALQFS